MKTTSYVIFGAVGIMMIATVVLMFMVARCSTTEDSCRILLSGKTENVLIDPFSDLVLGSEDASGLIVPFMVSVDSSLTKAVVEYDSALAPYFYMKREGSRVTIDLVSPDDDGRRRYHYIADTSNKNRGTLKVTLPSAEGLKIVSHTYKALCLRDLDVDSITVASRSNIELGSCRIGGLDFTLKDHTGDPDMTLIACRIGRMTVNGNSCPLSLKGSSVGDIVFLSGADERDYDNRDVVDISEAKVDRFIYCPADSLSVLDISQRGTEVITVD